MKNQNERPKRSREKGVALVIAIFALLLISAIAVGMIIMSGSEAAIAGNYRNSTQSFYAAYAGLEEGRGRIWAKHPNTIRPYPPGGAPFIPQVLAVGQVRYILNPSAGEVVTPLTAGSTYYDNEYTTEFGANPVAGNTQTTNSISGNLVAGVPGPLFKWVRVTAKTELSGQIDVNGDAFLNNAIPLYYDGTNLNLTSTGNQVLNVTALAVLPGGSRRILQYTVSPPVPFPIQAALFTQLADNMGSTLNVHGVSEQVCSVPNVYGVKSGNAITIPGGSAGNFNGSPASTQANSAFPYNVPQLINMLKVGSTQIDAVGTGVVQSAPGDYLGVSTAASPVVLGTPPVTNPAIPPPNQISTSNGGTPVTYFVPGNLTLGGPALAGPSPIGNGALLVDGDLTLDISHGFYYFGLIIVRGNIRLITTANTTAGVDIHGAVLGGGTFNSAGISNMGGASFSANIQVNPCYALQGIMGQPITVISFREITQ